jgi:polyhydroxyalkanoate synthesis regulator phasin
MITVIGASAASTTSDVMIRLAGLSRKPARTKPEVMPRINAIEDIVGGNPVAGYSCVMARREVDSLISKLRQLSEEGAASFFHEVMASDRLRKGLGRAGESLFANKQSFDRNVESLLDFVNVPSKRDVRELKSRLDTLSTQLVNLSMKVDRMLAAERGSSESPPPSPATKPKRRRQT